MKHFLITTMIALAVAQASAESPAPKKYFLPSWGDMTLLYGPEMDAAMDTEQAMENMVQHWKGRGWTGVFLRSDLAQFPPGAIIRHNRNTQPVATLALSWHIIDVIMEKADPHRSLQRAGDKLGFEYWIFHPHIYSDGAPVDVGVKGPGRMIPWSYILRYHQDHPEVVTVDRDGNTQWMVSEYAYPGIRAYRASEFAHMARTYHPTGIIASMRSESNQAIPPPEHADQFGFNQPVVDEMKRLYNVNILTDPRFDWKSKNFDLQDSMLQNWRNLRGSHITQLYREIRKAMRDADPKVQFAAGLAGEAVGPVMGNAKLDWRTWVDEGIVDVLIVGNTNEATLDMDSTKKGYLTDARNGKGTVTVAQVKEYILKSKHPEIRVIQTGAPSYFYPPPPEGADGWQCDAWYDSYGVAFYQRWEQWKKDLTDQGFIKFFEQNFDSFAAKDPGVGGAVGDGRYHHDIRACPGFWYKLGDGGDGPPYVQQGIRRGTSGSAIALTGKELISWHLSSPDRSRFTDLDTAITNGKATLSYWVYRDNDQNSITAYFTGKETNERDVAVRVEAKTGRVSYANGKAWVESEVVVQLKEWTPITIDVDLDTLTYSVHAGAKLVQLCSRIAISRPKDRFVTQNGVESVAYKVPSYRYFNMLIFAPTEGSRAPVYLDEVLVKWTPVMHYAPKAPRKLLDESFESTKFGSADLESKAWRVVGSTLAPKPFYIERTTSFGEGVQCLRATGGGTFVSELGEILTTASANGAITVDLDLFIRSDKGFPFIIPDPTTHSAHSVVIGLQGLASDQSFAAVDSEGGKWRLWDGKQFVDTGKLINYDVWNHMQLAIDSQAKRYRLIVQPIGELPTVIGEGACGGSVKADEKLKLTIKPSDTKEHISCYDNIVVTSN